MRNLGDARPAPRSPEFDQRELVPGHDVKQADFLAGQVVRGEVADGLGEFLHPLGREHLEQLDREVLAQQRLQFFHDLDLLLVLAVLPGRPQCQQPCHGILKVDVDGAQRLGRRLARLVQRGADQFIVVPAIEVQGVRGRIPYHLVFGAGFRNPAHPELVGLRARKQVQFDQQRLGQRNPHGGFAVLDDRDAQHLEARLGARIGVTDLDQFAFEPVQPAGRYGDVVFGGKRRAGGEAQTDQQWSLHGRSPCREFTLRFLSAEDQGAAIATAWVCPSSSGNSSFSAPSSRSIRCCRSLA